MRLTNLGDGSSHVSFAEALRRGIAPDGSLYFPYKIPTFTPDEIEILATLDQKQRALLTLKKWLGDEISEDDLRKIVDQSCNFSTPLKKVGDRFVLELFHGPTMAFKDVAARYLAALMNHFKKPNEKLTVLVATSGDTGGAIAQGFADTEGISVVVLFPKGRVSELQYEQLTRVAKNILSVEVEGSFDDCQALVKQAFTNAELSQKLGLTSANSISIGRLLPQITYYVEAYSQLSRNDLRIVIPTGNLGNLTAAILAWKMGIPIKRFIGANNENDALTRYLDTGLYEPLDSVQTLSNAMDVGAPNNLPRFQAIFSSDVEQARSMVSALKISDKETIDTMKFVYENYGYLLDPHTAVGWAAADQEENDKFTDIVVSTASPVKFSKEIEAVSSIKIDNVAEIEQLRSKPQRLQSIGKDYSEFEMLLSNL